MKYDFGQYSILGAVTHRFQKAPDWWWKIRPVTSGDELKIMEFIYRNREYEDAHGNMRYVPPTNLEICHREIAMLFDGTNIPAEKDRPVAEGGAPVLEVGATIGEIEDLLREMPHAMVQELWEQIAIANPDGKWGPGLPNQEPAGSPTGSDPLTESG